ncbi:peptidylprolyl isomerase [Bacterioplanes sanyensis]|uniref:Peptidyl-prolyl cis-trans isomerase n=1 Tax=Bacterioplanes sanyensis TaxID=1249553 RepID=A0A222FLT1_9GAMM|nr:FKBP-type peptidyl-prolyl cis-trans isomerase [Bacterioplanes sanyensis]ASP39474.1 peptidylprolyl isomerase [Bacterioplanes sanyensis]
MKLKTTAPALILGAALLAGCGQEETPTVKIETHIDQASYGVGLNFGRQLAGENLELNEEALVAGIRDAMSDAEQRVDDETIQAAFAQMREDHVRKQEALNDEMAQKSEAFLQENASREGVVVLDSGLQYEVMTAGNGEGESPAATDTVSVHYHGTLTDGSVFDSSVDRGEPAQFPVNMVIKGWTEALQLMKPGDKWKLFIPADLAYGARSPSPKIPANAALVFEVELLEVVEQG